MTDIRPAMARQSPKGKQTLERVPSERHLPADVYVEATLANRWSCKKGQNL